MSRFLAVVMVSLVTFLATPALAGHGHGCWGGCSGISFGVGYGPYCGYGYGYGYRPRFYGGYYGGYGYGSYYGGGYNPYGIYYSPFSGYSDYYLPPVFAPAELLYGPRAVQQFWGMNNRPLVLVRNKVVREKPEVRVSNPEYRRKADQLLAQGDRLFREQKYTQAIDRYKQAAEMAPDLAETQWRKGHAYIAMHRYELAAAAFKRALTLKPDVGRAGFDLSKLYGPGAMVKTSHLEALAGETLMRSDSADHYFLLGVFLRYDGQAERAEKFFVRAGELAGVDATYLTAFLLKADVAVPVSATELET